MKIQIKLFAVAKEIAEREVIDVELAEGSSVPELRDAIVEQFPALAEVVRHAMFAVNSQYADNQTELLADSEVACIPPVSGG